MSFKIINPGYGTLLTASDNPSYIDDDTFTTYASDTYNPTHGVAFWGGDGTAQGYRIPAIRAGGTFYFKFDMYVPAGDNWRVSIGIGSDIDSSDYTHLSFYYSRTESCCETGFIGGSYVVESIFDDQMNEYFKLDAINSVWGFFKLSDTDEENGTCKLIVNDKTVIDEPECIFKGGESTLAFVSVHPKSPISNVIISDEFIDPKEIIVRVDNSAIETTMLESDTTYRSASAGDYVLEVLDTSQLYSTFGANGKVSGMVAIAAPAYTTGNDITKLKCRTVDGETVTDYDEQNLGTDASGVVAEYLTFDSDTTFASLNGFKVGWVTGA